MEPNTMVTLATVSQKATQRKRVVLAREQPKVFVGAPISQTIYGMLLMNFILSKAAESGFTNWGGCLGAGIFGGLGMMASAWYQGKSAAVACDALGETGKGMVNYLMVLGIVETVALFVLVFSMMVL